MGNLFNLDNGFFAFMGKVWDLIWLNILWVVCCIPIVTIGPATTALYYAVVKVIRRERGYVTREFFHSFKDNLKLGSLSTIVYLILAYILYVDFTFAFAKKNEGATTGEFLVAGFIAVTTIIVFTLVFTYPILSRFTLNFKGLFKTSFLISMKHFPTSFFLTVLVVACGLGIYIMPLFLFVVPSLCCLINSLLIERVFKKYMPKPEGTSEETGRDQWYWE